MYMYIYIYIHIYIYVYVYTYTYTYMYMFVCIQHPSFEGTTFFDCQSLLFRGYRAAKEHMYLQHLPEDI